MKPKHDTLEILIFHVLTFLRNPSRLRSFLGRNIGPHRRVEANFPTPLVNRLEPTITMVRPKGTAANNADAQGATATQAAADAVVANMNAMQN